MSPPLFIGGYYTESSHRSYQKKNSPIHRETHHNISCKVRFNTKNHIILHQTAAETIYGTELL